MPIVFGIDSTSGRYTTNIFAICGADTAFEHSDYPTLSVRKFSDLPTDLLLATEIRDSGVHWMQPGDHDVDKLLTASGRLSEVIAGIQSDRTHVMFADGEVWALYPDTPMTALHPFLTITGAKNADRDELLAAWRVN